MLRSLTVFSIVCALHFFLSVLGLMFALPETFQTQHDSVLARVPNVLLAPLGWMTPPLPLRKDFGYLDIALVSASFGGIATALHYFVRKLRGKR